MDRKHISVEHQGGYKPFEPLTYPHALTNVLDNIFARMRLKTSEQQLSATVLSVYIL